MWFCNHQSKIVMFRNGCVPRDHIGLQGKMGGLTATRITPMATPRRRNSRVRCMASTSSRSFRTTSTASSILSVCQACFSRAVPTDARSPFIPLVTLATLSHDGKQRGVGRLVFSESTGVDPQDDPVRRDHDDLRNRRNAIGPPEGLIWKGDDLEAPSMALSPCSRLLERI